MDHALLQTLATRALQCTHQPYSVKASGKLVYDRIRSHCEDVLIASDRAEFHLESGIYAIVLKDNVNTDGGDLNDLYIAYNGREDQEVLVQESLLAFGDPIVGLLLVAGHDPEKLEKVLR